ncbi:MAG: zinc ribbon domain-containing protein [Euryarchaeota archaeon]|nr:zinc ribbon domain-containing protein [Euryarchaeota archaeon]
MKSKNVRIVVEIKDEPFGIRDFTVEDTDGYKLTFNQPSGNVRKCMSCGMHIMKPGDFGGGSTDNLFCAHCTTQDGSLRSYGEVPEGMMGFMMMTQKMDRSTAEGAARGHMSRMPAWGRQGVSLRQSEDARTPELPNWGLPHILYGAVSN